MPSLDVVSQVDMQALDNAINNVKRELSTRFDFKNVRSEVTLDRKAKEIHITSGDDGNVKAITEMLVGQCVRLKIDPKCLEIGKIEPTTPAKLEIKINQGIPRETAQKMVKFIKGTKIKVQPVIQEEQLRVSGKSIDDLREVMRLLLEQDYQIPLQFVNMKS